MAKKDKKDDEYKDENIHNQPEQDDEDFGLPDLNDEANEPEDEYSQTEEEIASEASFDTDETSDSPIYEEQIDEDTFVSDEYEEEELVSTGYQPPRKQSAAPIIITFSIIVILACVAVWYLFIRKPVKEEPIVQAPIEDTTTYVVEKPIDREPEVIEPEEPQVGEINILNSRTGRSYVVVGSFFDEDLAQDYAKELIKSGTNAYIIPPFGKSKFNRVAIEENTTFADASVRATELAGQYKEQPWPLKY